MTMRSPVVALLWENWRLTRVEAAQRLALGIVAASGALVVFDATATVAFLILLTVHAMFWFSIAKLSGGRFVDGYKPGFPFYLHYTRPVPTVMSVGVAMAYDAVSCAVLYVVSAALVGFAFGQPLPLFSVIVGLVAFHLTCTCIQWSIRNRVVQWLGSFAIWGSVFLLLNDRVTSPFQVQFSLAENALMVLIGVVSFGLTVAGVARQRRGDALATGRRPARSGGYPDWLVNLFRVPCPTSSATRAQVWFDVKSSGLPVLAIGLALAVLNPLLFAVSIRAAWLRPFALLCAFISAPAVLILGGNAFGIRRRQGRTYVSAFEATQPYGVAQMAYLKVLVRTACVLAALIAIGVSVWTSSSLVSAWGPWVMDGQKDSSLGLLQLRGAIGNAFEGLAGHAYAAQAVVASVAVVVLVASLAAFMALRARYPRRLLVASSLLLVYSLTFILLVLGANKDIVPASVVGAFVRTTGWIAGTVTVSATVYLSWRALAERLLTLRQAGGAILLSAAFGAAWMTVLRTGDVQLGAMSTTNIAWILSPALLPLMASLLAPWSLARVRHT